MTAVERPAVNRDRLRSDRLALLQTEMQRQGVGALYLRDGPTSTGAGIHARYLLDVKIPGVAVFVPAEGEMTIFAPRRDIGYLKLREHDVRATFEAPAELRDAGGEPAGDLANTLKNLMARNGVARERLGIDIMKPRPLLDLVAAGLNLVDAELVCERACSVKSEDEIEMYRVIGQQYIRIFETFRRAVRPGVTELELAALVSSTWSQVGGEDVAQLNVCSGENMNPWRRWATERALVEGEFVGIDFHGRGICGLRGDGSTTFFVGDHPTPEQRDLYRQAYDYLQAAIPVLRAGRPIPEIMLEQPPVPEPYRAQQFNYHLAHGIGMGPSGYPHMDPRSKPIEDVLQPNQVLSVECFFGEEGSPLAVKLEQQILVRDGAPEIIGRIPVDDWLLG